MESTELLGLDTLLDRILAAPARLGATRLVCVDGPAGSGKTTLAGLITRGAEDRGLTVRTLHMDDLYEGWDGAERGFMLLRDHVLARIAAGVEGRYRRYDWKAGEYAERHDVPADLDLLVVEGVTSADRAVDDWTSLRIWVETSNSVRLGRGIDRDGEALRDRWLDWMRWEREHYAAEHTRDRADLVVDGSPSIPHDPEREIVIKTRADQHRGLAS